MISAWQKLNLKLLLREVVHVLTKTQKEEAVAQTIKTKVRITRTIKKEIQESDINIILEPNLFFPLKLNRLIF